MSRGAHTDPPAWTRCECCDDFVCNIHEGQHAWECPCPPIEVWIDAGLDPYEDSGKDFKAATEATPGQYDE